jgi:hypothetical protein
MQSVPNTQTILQVATICQYLSTGDIKQKNFSGDQIPNKTLPRLIRSIRKSVQWAFGINPSDPTLNGTGPYLWALCAPYSQTALNTISNVAEAAPTVTGPANDSVIEGNNASFTIGVTSSISYTIQWYKNGSPIVGANALTYVLTDAQLTDSGSTFYASVTNAAGTVVSNTATLTVAASLIGYAYAGSADYSTELLSGTDDVPYQFTFPITHGDPLSIQFPGLVNAEYIVIKYPSTEGVKTQYNNLPIDSGAIPSIAWENIATITSWNYAFSRTGNPFTLNSANLLGLQ